MKRKYMKQIAGMLALMCLLLVSCKSGNQGQQNDSHIVNSNPMPWDKPGVKQPDDYTWEEYNALTGVQQVAFKRYLGGDGYEAWLDRVQTQQETFPWEVIGAKQPQEYTWEEFISLTQAQQVEFREYLGENEFMDWADAAQSFKKNNPWDVVGAKQPEDYTWEEFESLTAEQQTDFQLHLGAEKFDEWLHQAQNAKVEYPWDKPGAKLPEDYTWEEFELLTAGQQTGFQQYLGEEKFDEWLNRAQNPVEEYPWNKPGAKHPSEYTWEEFEMLTANQQMAFQNHLGAEAFEGWLSRAQGQMKKYPWENAGAKQPGDYTWEEFEALSAEEQRAFQNYLGGENFDKWLDRAQNQRKEYPWEKNGAKQPEDYTWEEFEALSAEEQMAFQNALGEETFEVWLNQAQSQPTDYPWEKPGAKQPDDYTMDEFEALSAEEQMAFQNELGPEAFEAWLNRVAG